MKRFSLAFRRAFSISVLSVWIAVAFAAVFDLRQSKRAVDQFRDDQHQLMENEGRSIAHNISGQIAERTRMLRVFTEQHRDLLTEFLHSDEDPVLRERLRGLIASYFPNFFAFALRDDQGRLVPDDLGELVGQVCRRDITEYWETYRTFSHVVSLPYMPFIHPQALNYHYDTMTQWQTAAGTEAILFVSFFPLDLAATIADFELPGHDAYLVRRDQPDLIEVSSRGARDTLDREIRLTAEELSKIGFTMPIKNTRWDVKILPEAGFFEAHAAAIWRQAALIFAGISVFAIVASWLIFRARSQRKVAYDRAAALKAKLEEAQRMAHTGSWSHDLVRNETYWSGEFARIFGIDSETFGNSMESLVDTVLPEDRSMVIEQYRASLAGKSDYDLEHRIIRRADGEVRWIHIKCVHMRDASGRIIRSDGTVQDITDRKRDQEEIRRLAMTDQLTGLANRNQFHIGFDKSLKLARRENKRLALVMLDLDKFKPVNDTFGHPTGDALLKAVAGILSHHTRETDLVARLGGDEFAIILVHPDDHNAVATSMQRILKEVCQEMTILGHRIKIGTSIGIAMFPEDANNQHDLIQKADLALYDAKHRGRNTYRFYKPELEMQSAIG